MSWNIDRGSKLHKVIEFLAGEKADIVLLQEADLNARRTHHINVAREIAQKLAMNYVFGREFQELTQGSKTSPAYHGQATLSHWPLSNSRIIRFQRQSHFWRPHWSSRSPALSGEAGQRRQYCGQNNRYLQRASGE